MMNRPTLIILCGLPGSGKTTYAEKCVKLLSNTFHLSSDAIRAELYNDASIQGDPTEVFSLMQNRAIEILNNGQDVVYDATNITRRDRACIINRCPKFVNIECHIIWAPIEICIERDAARERTVGKTVIDKMVKRFQCPYFDEGINRIEIIRPDNFDFDNKDEEYTDDIFKSMKIPHDNPHHQLDVYNHCLAACHYAIDNHFSKDICIAAMLHDCGKPYCKAFINSKGESSEVAHYYQHQCVSAYIACGIIRNIDTIWLISTHMAPFLNEKYYQHLPPYLKKTVDQLHECDLNAH